MRKKTAETQDHESGQEMAVDNDNSLEDMMFVPIAARASLFGSSTCATRSANAKSFNFFDPASVRRKRVTRRIR